MIKTITGAFKRLTLHRAVERDQQAALDRFDQIKWEEYEAAKAALWRKLELQYLKDVNTLQHEMLHDEPIDRGIMLEPGVMAAKEAAVRREAAITALSKESGDGGRDTGVEG